MLKNIRLIFLGTGASGGTAGIGKSKRLESSLFIKNTVNILIDITRDFSKQSKGLRNIDCVLITHGHRDACGGLVTLNRWVAARNKKGVSVYAHPKTIKVIKKRFKKIEHLKLFPFSKNRRLKLGPWLISAHEVPHSWDSKFPTFAWKLVGPKTIVYASDISEITDKFKKFCQGVNILVLDGATWKRKIFSHLRVDKDLLAVCGWNIDKIILTQIGKSAPSYSIFEREVKLLCAKAIPAYDGMRHSI